MKKLNRILSILTLAAVMICSITACKGTVQDGTIVSASDADDWMNEKEATVEEKKAETGNEYFDIFNVDDEEVDYSKYEERITTKEGTTADSAQNGETSDDISQQDVYLTDPVPEGQPSPVEPEDAEADTSKELTCYLSISCTTILDNMEELTEGKEDLVPSDGMIFDRQKVIFYEGESVFDILLRVTRNNRIHMEFVDTPKYNSAYIEGINNLYEFDCGSGSGWMYKVNGWYPNYGCSRYAVQDGDEIEWNYTCDLGRDLGQSWMD